MSWIFVGDVSWIFVGDVSWLLPVGPNDVQITENHYNNK